MCDCVNVEPQTYANQVLVDPPASISEPRVKQGLSPQLSVDKCLVGELKELWDMGIVTTGCCCGHNNYNPYIGVLPENIPQMKKLGYEVQFNPMRPHDEDQFWPKTVDRPAIQKAESK